MLTMLESLNYSFRNPQKKHNLSNLPHQTVEKLQKKTMGSSEDPSLVNNVDELGLVNTVSFALRKYRNIQLKIRNKIQCYKKGSFHLSESHSDTFCMRLLFQYSPLGFVKNTSNHEQFNIHDHITSLYRHHQTK